MKKELIERVLAGEGGESLRKKAIVIQYLMARYQEQGLYVTPITMDQYINANYPYALRNLESPSPLVGKQIKKFAESL